jgi:hypothetical protein
VSGIRRVRWREGALLSACDLATAAESAARTDALHVRGAHATSGVAFGLAVELHGSIVEVGAGLAYDRCGGAIAVPDVTLVHVPAADGDYVLVAGPHGRRWRRRGCAGDDEVALAALTVTKGKPGALDATVCRGARGPGSARIASGRAQISVTNRLESARRVDTAAGGFQQTPFYFVTITPPATGTLPHWNDVYGPWLELRKTTRASFELVTRFARPQPTLPGGRRLAIEWLGVEPRTEQTAS